MHQTISFYEKKKKKKNTTKPSSFVRAKYVIIEIV